MAGLLVALPPVRSIRVGITTRHDALVRSGCAPLCYAVRRIELCINVPVSLGLQLRAHIDVDQVQESGERETAGIDSPRGKLTVESVPLSGLDDREEESDGGWVGRIP